MYASTFGIGWPVIGNTLLGVAGFICVRKEYPKMFIAPVFD